MKVLIVDDNNRYAENLEKYFALKNIETKIEGTVEEGATIHGNVILGKNSVIKAGSYLDGNFIIGENTVIGPNCHLRKFGAVGDNCVVGFAVEVNSCVIGDGVHAKHHANLDCSILGNNVNIAAGTMIANLRHDNANIKTMINGKLVDTGRRKFGAIIGDNAKLGIQTTIYPGRKIYNGVWTLPGEIIKEDKEK
jgi:bifunctional UDP-N-acetylglucosamine pyrophosphorylase/glucosamine-1-phosphate N-acetyltransferase